MIDRKAGELCEQHERVLVLGIELVVVALICEIQVSVKLICDEYRDAENVVIGGCPAGKP